MSYFFSALKSLSFFTLFLLLFSSISTPLTAAPPPNNYYLRYHTLANGGISFTGNTLGLSKQSQKNNPGTSDSIGAFITTDSSQSAPSTGTPWPVVVDPPAGTTLNWQDNISSAFLDIPTGSTILYAELIWSGSYGFNGQIPYPGNPFIPDVTSVTLVSPQLAVFSIPPNPATAQQALTPGFSAAGNYVRSQDVTSIIQGGGPGKYTVGHVPGTVSALDDSHNAAGWTLAVVYSNPNMYTSDLSLFVTCQQASNSQAGTISGFCAPPTSPVITRLFVSATEGDANITGDQMRLNNVPLSGSNNPSNNFFCSQINTIVGLQIDANGKLVLINPPPATLPDTRGTFGLRNQTPPTDIVAGRQGYDITSVDATGTIPPNATSATVQGTTTGDDYTISSIGVLIQVGAPILVSNKTVNGLTSIVSSVGDIVNYSINIKNIGTTTAYQNLFSDVLSPGLSFVSGSFKINGVPQPNPDHRLGVNLGDLAVNQTVVVDFQAKINGYPENNSVYENQASVRYEFIPCASGSVTTELETATNFALINFLPVANPDFGTTLVNIPFQGSSVLDNDIGTGIKVTSYTPPTQGGTVVIFQDGSYLYTPPTNFVGVDTFTYTITDSLTPSHTSTTTVTITVTPNNVPPMANDDSGTTWINTPLNGASVLDNDVGDELIVISNSQSTNGGSVLVNTDGTYLYIPPLDFIGIDTFTYTAEDVHGNQTSATVYIEVTPSIAPYANDDSYTTLVNTPVSGNVLLNDSASVTVYVSNTPPSHGIVVFDPSNNGDFTYTPNPGFIGQDVFTYTARDALNNLVMATVTITVEPLAPPTDFVGTVHKCKLLNKTEYSLIATWSPSPSGTAVAYQIFYSGVPVARIPASGPLVFTTCLKKKNQAGHYEIAAVNQLNLESTRIIIRIVHE